MADKTPTPPPKTEVHVDPKFQKALDQVRATLPDSKRADFDRAVAEEKTSVREHRYGGALARELTFDVTAYSGVDRSLPQLMGNEQDAKNLIRNLRDIGHDVSQKIDAANKHDTSSMTPEKAAETKADMQLDIKASLSVQRDKLYEIGDAITKAAHNAITVTEPPPEPVKPHTKAKSR